MTRGEPELISPGAKFLVLGLGLLFLGCQDAADATLEVTQKLLRHFCRNIYCCEAILQAVVK